MFIHRLWHSGLRKPETPNRYNNMKTTDLQNVMYRAWAMHNSTGVSFRACLKRAWVLYHTTKTLRDNNYVHITYKKIDGTKRVALGTLRMNDGSSVSTMSTTRKPNHGVFTYYDLERGAFRSFRCENFIGCYV